MDRSSRDYIKQVRETKKPVMTGPSVSGTSGKLITIIAYPVLDGNELKGIVYGTIELDEISEIAGRIKYMETGRVFIASLPMRSSLTMSASWIYPKRLRIRQSTRHWWMALRMLSARISRFRLHTGLLLV